MAFVSGKGETIAAAGSTQEIEQSSVQDVAVKAAGPPSAGHVRPDCRAVVRFHSRKAPDVRHRTRIFPSLLPGAGLGHYQQADICQHAESAGISQPHHPVAVLTFSSL
ncbi:uncharacterized protein QC763_0107260 [Podospora pseudopauciseta]|uniref:Uncharacterized protein n=1 Tax=Podospora pseudopauciseta TaxID=2093780 RepID=A0ABR0H1S2_9PEZI|nr:hypothetical protein QC763_0107260 [Podospora pseudopauciseta]